MKARALSKKAKPVPPGKYCNARKPGGGLCRNPAGARTKHKGTGRCSRHDGYAKKEKSIVFAWTSQVKHHRVKEIMARMARMEFDAMDLTPEANLLRALTIDYVNRYDTFVQALMAWYEDPESNTRPRRILDITEASQLIESISRVVQRMHTIQAEASITMDTFKRVTENMGMIVARYVKDPTVLNRIEYDWMNLAMDAKRTPALPLPPHVETVDAVTPEQETTSHG
jgi:predicted signal transduction protein with EAL and GGDEF domain